LSSSSPTHNGTNGLNNSTGSTGGGHGADKKILLTGSVNLNINNNLNNSNSPQNGNDKLTSLSSSANLLSVEKKLDKDRKHRISEKVDRTLLDDLLTKKAVKIEQIKDEEKKKEKAKEKITSTILTLKNTLTTLRKTGSGRGSFRDEDVIGEIKQKNAFEFQPLPLELKKIDFMIEFLKRHAPSTEGIFRISSGTAELKVFWDKFSTGKRITEAENSHTVAAALKLYIREQKDFIIPHSYYQKCIDALRKQEKQTLKSILLTIPEMNMIILKKLVGLCKLIANNSEVTKMTPGNLGVVWGPNILRPLVETSNTMMEGNYPVEMFADFVDNSEFYFNDIKDFLDIQAPRKTLTMSDPVFADAVEKKVEEDPIEAAENELRNFLGTPTLQVENKTVGNEHILKRSLKTNQLTHSRNNSNNSNISLENSQENSSDSAESVKNIEDDFLEEIRNEKKEKRKKEKREKKRKKEN